MKSLEIVNEKLSNGEEIISKKGNYYRLTNEQLETIKQDLEVLEILRKYIPENWSGFQIIYSEKENRIEDWKRLKQWLEENQ